MLEITATCLVLTALLAYLNFRFIQLPITIGVMVTALLLSLGIIVLDLIGVDFGLHHKMEDMLRAIDFSNVLMQGMLSFLLFAGALHIDLSELRAYRWQVLVLAVFSTLLSTFIVGLAAWYVLPYLGISLPLLYCLLFGALISPTDPIAVMGILKSAGIPKNLELVISGESLFNDGVGVVIFSILMSMLLVGEAPSFHEGLGLLMHEAGGGLLYGLLIGYITFYLLRSIDNYQVEVMITLAAVMGGYVLASKLHVSGPLAMVVAGLVVGNHGRELAMSDTTRLYVDMFWEMIDDILNAVLFVLIGMEVMLIAFSWGLLAAGLAMVIMTLIARGLTVWMPVHYLPGYFKLPRGAGLVLTWGGLRGGISVALALSLPSGGERDVILSLTYCIVVVSILVQGLTVGKLAEKATEPEAAGVDGTDAPEAKAS
ncbi:MAG: sodium:proton antiporter [Betaproteobacteria bacterium]|nr:sodium:proton antiporter [Betaproteobacteria bacterium]